MDFEKAQAPNPESEPSANQAPEEGSREALPAAPPSFKRDYPIFGYE